MKENVDGRQGKINMIITFDDHGVSGHPNHQALFKGVNDLMERRLVRDVEVMTLTSVNILRKYLGIIDVNFILDEWQSWRFNVFEAYKTLAEHKSQLVWFRKLFVIFSRYTYINSFYRYV